MNDVNIGIKSLAERLAIVEKKILEMNTSKSFEDQLINTTMNAKSEYQRSELIKIKQHFMNGIETKEIEKSNDNIFNIVRHVVIYVEANIKKISLLIETEITSDFKQHIAISLIKDVLIDSNLSDDFLKNSIDSMVDLIFNSNKKHVDPKPVEEVSDIKEPPQVENIVHTYITPAQSTKKKWKIK